MLHLIEWVKEWAEHSVMLMGLAIAYSVYAVAHLVEGFVRRGRNQVLRTIAHICVVVISASLFAIAALYALEYVAASA